MKTFLMRDGSGRSREYRYLLEHVSRHGQVRIYFRRDGKMIRMKEKPGTVEFDRAYDALLRSELLPVIAPKSTPFITDKRGTLGALIKAYYASDSGLLALGASTQTVKRSILDEIAVTLGDELVEALEPRHIAALRDAKRREGKHEAGNKRVKDMRALFKWATGPEINLTQHNPAASVQYLSPKKKGGHAPWTLEEIDRYRARWPVGTKARLALDLFLYTGVRVSDVILLGKQMERRGPNGDNLRWLHFTEYKNREREPKERDIPILPVLQASIDATPSGHMLYLVTEHGKPYASAKAFSNRFKSWCVMAGLPDVVRHGVRKAGSTIAAENGASAHQLMSIFGWTSIKQAEHYTRAADRKRLVKGAMPLLETGSL